MGLIRAHVLLVICTAMDFTNGFYTERVLVDTEPYPTVTERDMSSPTEKLHDLTTDNIEANVNEISNKQMDEMFGLAYGALQEERRALGELLTTVQTRSILEMDRLHIVSDLIEKYMDGKDDGVKVQGGRRHRKRSTFDSISHNGVFGHLGQSESERRRGKLAFTFQNLLPYLLNEQRRNSRSARRRH